MLVELSKLTGKGSFISVSSELKPLQRELRRFGRAGVDKAMTRSQNTAIRRAKTQAKRSIAKKRNLVQANVEDKLKVQFATGNRRVTAITATGQMIPLTKLRGGVTNPVQKPLGVAVKIGPGRKTLIHGAFIARMPSGHIGVFNRESEAGVRVPRLGIDEDKLPSIPHTLVMPVIRKEVVARYHAVYQATLGVQLKAGIRRANKRIRGAGR